MGRKTDYDWPRIEADFRTGKFTNRELSAKHGPAHQVIARRALKYGWKQDLTEMVRQRTNSILMEKVSEGVAEVSDAVTAAALTNANVIDRHRKLLSRLQATVDQLADELSQANVAAAAVDPEKVASAALEAGVSAQALGKLLAAAEIERRSAVVDRLSGAVAKLVPLERKAHGLDVEGQASSDADKLREALELARGIE